MRKLTDEMYREIIILKFLIQESKTTNNINKIYHHINKLVDLVTFKQEVKTQEKDKWQM